MKKIIYALFVSFSFFLFSCKTAYLDVKVTYSPYLYIPSHIKSIVVYNRSWSDSIVKKANSVESVLSGEAFAGDKLASEDCINAFANGLNGYNNIHVFVPVDHMLPGGLTVKVMPALDWQKVKEICRANKVDALVVLEAFDTNSDALLGTVLSGVSIVTYGGTPPKTIHFTINYEWRFYDTLSMSIFDVYGDALHQAHNSVTPFDPLPTSVVRNNGIWLGEQYAYRFLPVVTWQPRNYFKKANNQFKIAARKVQMNDWNGAMEIWQVYTSDPSKKIAGRACYNMALGCEVNGNIALAKEWCKKAYTEYKVKRSRDYLFQLNNLPNQH